jgi:hypothetical protein
MNENIQIKKMNGDSHAYGLLRSAVSFRELEYSVYLVLFFFLSSLFLKLEFFFVHLMMLAR